MDEKIRSIFEEIIYGHLKYEGFTSRGKYRAGGVEYTSTGLKKAIETYLASIQGDLTGNQIKQLKEGVPAMLVQIQSKTYVRPMAKLEPGINSDGKSIILLSPLEVHPGAYRPKPHGRSFLAYNETDGTFLDARKLDYTVTIPHVLGVEIKDLYDIEVPICSVHFDPTRTEKSWEYEIPEIGKRVTRYNLFKAPAFMRYNSDKQQIAPFISSLLNNLFPIESEKNYVLGWIKQCLISRNNVALVLYGDRGVGKSFFTHVVGALVGRHYFENLDKSILSDKFTGSIEGKRLGAFEETSLQPEYGEEGNDALESMKRLMNSTVRYERKGQDAHTGENYCSFMLSLNRTSPLGVGPQERRFSIPTIGEANLNTVISSEELAYYSKELIQDVPSEKVQKELKEFYNYLMANEWSEFDDSVPLRGEAFFISSSRALTSGQMFIIKELISKADGPDFVLNLPLLRKQAMKLKKTGENVVIPQNSRIIGFLADYLHMGKCKIGTIVETRDEHKNIQSHIKINPKFYYEFCDAAKQTSDTDLI